MKTTWTMLKIFLLTGSNLVLLLGFSLAAQKPPRSAETKEATRAQSPGKIWKSLTTKRKYRVRIENDVLHQR